MRRIWLVIVTVAPCLFAVRTPGQPVDLPRYEVIDLGSLGVPYTYALGMNDLGQVVGEADRADGETVPFVWSEATGIVELSTLTSTLPPKQRRGGAANDINNHGIIVGNCWWMNPKTAKLVLTAWDPLESTCRHASLSIL